MKHPRKLGLLLIGLTAGTLLTTGCLDDPKGGGNSGNDLKGGNGFDYATTNVVSLRVDYSVPGNKALFEVFDRMPVQIENGVAVRKTGVEALLKAYTDENSRYEGIVNLPTGTEKVYLYSAAYGLPTCLEVSRTESGITVDLAEFQKKLRTASNASAHVTSRAADNDNPYNIQLLGQINSQGMPYYIKGTLVAPNYFQADFAKVPSGLMNRIQHTLMPGENNAHYARPTEVVNLNVRQDAHLTLVFAAEWGAFHNAIGYYFYPTANPPKSRAEMEALPKYVAFPNVTSWTTSFTGDELIDINNPSQDWVAPLWVGEQLELKYFKDGKASSLFPAGTTVGWFLLPDGFEMSGYGGSLDLTGSRYPIRYSNNEFNEGANPYMVSLYDKVSGKTVLGFEDSGDNDFKDVLFYIDADPAGSIEDPDRPETEDPDNPHPDVVGDPITGTLVFEDLWPSQGDYDMNDVVVGYHTTFTTDKENRILQIEDVFTPLHSGGKLKSAFGYELDLPASAIKGVQIENASTSATLFEGLETKQQKPVIMLFDDIAKAVSQGPVTVKITLDGSVSMKSITRKTLYNPFICPSSAGFAPETLRKEIHLTNYAPTSLADPYPFGRNDDKSSLDQSGNPVGPYYYVTSELYPFALDLPITDYRIPAETVEMGEFYPSFPGWVKSTGTENKDWYLKPRK